MNQKMFYTKVFFTLRLPKEKNRKKLKNYEG